MLVQKTDTPRPRPPAQMRRSASLNKNFTTPPPAYASAIPPARKQPRLDSLLGSPMLATFHKVGWDADGQPVGSPASHEADWVDEQSREELSELLDKADDMIKERETELDLTSAVCKTLYEDNVALKSKHQALLARLPSSSPSHGASPSISASPLAPTSSGYAHSPATSPAPPTAYIRGHGRKISVSPADISLLSDQNAELLDKLERLEADSFSADRSGRRALKRLEKEIAGLREELEKTQARSEEIEERAKTGFGWGAEKVVHEVWRKKKEREERFRAMRENMNAPADAAEVRNFAPESPFGGMVYTPAPRRMATPSDNFFTEPREVDQPSPPENQLISQLLTKIQELEETNERIIQQQVETTSQLEAVQRETEHINKVYEYLGDPNQFEVIGDAPDVAKDSHKILEEETVRFKSFKRTLEGQMVHGDSDPSSAFNVSTVSKTRKSVMGLFDAPGAGTDAPPALPKSLGLPVPFEPAPKKHHASWSVSSHGLASPALSTMSIPTPPTHLLPELSPLGGPRRTLDAELGDIMDEPWGPSPRMHQRLGSLYDLGQFSSSQPPSPSPFSTGGRSRSASPLPFPPPLVSRLQQKHSETIPTPPSLAGGNVLRLSVEPPTPERFRELMASPGKGERHIRMTETLRSRTHRWADGRFGDSLVGQQGDGEPHGEQEQREQDHHGAVISRPTTPLPQRLLNTFDAVVDTISARPEFEGTVGRSLLLPTPGPAPAPDSIANTHAGSAEKDKKKSVRLGAVLLELWLWLQFAVIILVFLWAMARRGPKAVLGDAQHRRVASERVR